MTGYRDYKNFTDPLQVGTGHVCKVVPKTQPGLSRSATKSSIYVAPNGELVAPDSAHLSPGETSALVALGSYYQNNERRLRHQLQDFPHYSYPAFWGYTRDYFLGNDPKYYYAPYMRSQLLSPHYHCDRKTGGYVLCEPFHPCWSTYSMY